MWDIQPIETDRSGFSVHSGSVDMMSWVLDPTLPWVLVEGHDPLRCIEWTTITAPLSPASLTRGRSLRVCEMEMTLLMPTEEFLRSLDEFDACGSGGLNAWQLDREPRAGLRLSDKMFDNDFSRTKFNQLCKDVGVRLAVIIPHRDEVSRVWGPNPADVEAAWRRGIAATPKVAGVENLILKLTELLRNHFPGSEPQIELMEGSGRVWGVVLWSNFEGTDQLNRQAKVWKVIRSALTSDELRSLGQIMTMTPAELADE